MGKVSLACAQIMSDFKAKVYRTFGIETSAKYTGHLYVYDGSRLLEGAWQVKEN